MSTPFKVYSTPSCPYCKKIKTVFLMTGQPFIEYYVGTHITKQEFFAQFGENASVPQITYGDKYIGGCSDTIVFLKENNMINGKTN